MLRSMLLLVYMLSQCDMPPKRIDTQYHVHSYDAHVKLPYFLLVSHIELVTEARGFGSRWRNLQNWRSAFAYDILSLFTIELLCLCHLLSESQGCLSDNILNQHLGPILAALLKPCKVLSGHDKPAF